MNRLKQPFIIPVFLPNIGCPHQCAFCNQKTITGINSNKLSLENITKQINTFLGYNRKNNKVQRHVQIAFYGGNFLGLSNKNITLVLNEASRYIAQKTVDSIRFSTRPDTINREKLNIIKDFPVSTIEIGVQSMNDKVLELSNRGHTSYDTKKAIHMIKEQNFILGLQIMVGLPGDNEEISIGTAKEIVKFSPDFTRIYPTVVLSESPLATWYKQGKYIPLTLEKCVTLVKKIYLIFHDAKISVIRMGLHSSADFDDGESILDGPYHPSFGHLVFSEIFLDMALNQIKKKNRILNEKIVIKVNPKNISRIRGLKNKNIDIIINKFNLKSLKVLPDSSLNKDIVEIC